LTTSGTQFFFIKATSDLVESGATGTLEQAGVKVPAQSPDTDAARLMQTLRAIDERRKKARSAASLFWLFSDG
jgi:hypothetical protein